MVKKLSLKEFYENGNTKPLIALLPTKPGDGRRDADQSCYDSQPSRLAELTLDSRISRPHSHYSTESACGASYGGAPSHAHVAPRHLGNQNYGGNGRRVGSGPYGDDDYYGCASNIRHPFGGLPPPSYGRGAYSPAGPPGSGTGHAAYSAAGPAGPGAPAAVGNGAVGSANNGAGQHHVPHEGLPAGYGRGLNQPFAAAGDDEDVWYPPPPPPPPRACPTPNSQQPGASAVQHRAASPYVDAPAGASLTAAGSAKEQEGEPVAALLAGQQPATVSAPVRAAAPPAAARPAGDGMAKGVVSAQDAAHTRHSSNGVVEVAAGRREAAQSATDHASAATPFAAAPTPAGPKNEFAERLAQKALANATRGKSSLLASGIASSLGSALSAGDALLPGAEDGASGEGAFVKPSHPFGRPRLVLKSRSAPAVAADSSRATTPSRHDGVSSSASSDSGTDAGEQGSIASSSVGSVRPRLTLQPRSLPRPDDHAAANGNAAASSGRHRLNLLPRGSGSAVPAADDAAVRKASVFGAAKPKDLPDPVLMGGAATARSGSSCLSEAAVARLGSTGGNASGRWGGGSSVSGGERDDDWHTVHGRKGGVKAGAGSALVDDLDPFFGHAGAAGSKFAGGSSAHVSVPAPSTFDRDIMRGSYRHYNNSNGYSKYGSSYDALGYSGSCGKRGSPGAGGWGGRGGWGGDDDAEAEADGGVFRRALPIRQAPFAL
ncbi:hypothetical protein COO60DRAFT_876091 [Scenedesmus sp. NREL 46B-D3]|nr:hypothetical protein COO60DRAFT_876091 [Scenedesmus sp. NREL 46B-D3]